MFRRIAFASLGLFAAGVARGQDLDPQAYRQWVLQQRQAAYQQRLSDPIYQSYYGLRPYQGRGYVPRHAGPTQTVGRDYYRGPGGQVVTQDKLPVGGFATGQYRYMGRYGANGPNKTHH